MAEERPPRDDDAGEDGAVDTHPFARWQRRPMAEVPDRDQHAVREWIFRPSVRDRLQANRAMTGWFFSTMLDHATEQAAKSLRNLGRSLRLLDPGDISHEVMIRIEQRLPNRMREVGAWRGYLGIAVRKRVFEELRKKDGSTPADQPDGHDRRPRTTYLIESGEHLPDEHTDSVQQDWIPVRDTLRREVPPRLRSDRHREVFALWFPLPDHVWDLDSHRSRREIADLLGLSESMVQRVLDEIKEVMIDVMRSWLGDDDD
ncbi:RNA polymerase sigma factor [Nocardia caishijiensis]|uniref:Sigma-70 family RNA polymerase sigma factor n=1 Tax=Nocardia caishijiensis TaxID=184756 RepID=A0ABQ6YKI8_9NOCA|nr:hypothetical protein [Nocardia caishijiensis]KAF0846019.1 hypothetical protein FNL39_106414 [Nocardia caishijiensis]